MTNNKHTQVVDFSNPNADKIISGSTKSMTNQTKKTAVEWLGYELNTKLFYDISPELWEQVNDIFKKAKEMEKEQIIDAWIATENPLQRISAEQYYNKTYVNQTK